VKRLWICDDRAANFSDPVPANAVLNASRGHRHQIDTGLIRKGRKANLTTV